MSYRECGFLTPENFQVGLRVVSLFKGFETLHPAYLKRGTTISIKRSQVGFSYDLLTVRFDNDIYPEGNWLFKDDKEHKPLFMIIDEAINSNLKCSACSLPAPHAKHKDGDYVCSSCRLMYELSI